MIIKKCCFSPILINSYFLRKGILVTLTNDQGRSIQTEVSPLPGFSKESLEDAKIQLQRLKRKICSTWWTKHSLTQLHNFGLFPSVLFGIEAAIYELLETRPDQPVKSYSLFMGSLEEMKRDAEKAKKRKEKECKIKLGHLSLNSAFEIIDAVKNNFNIRLDMNRKWPIDKTILLCKKYPKDQFEYIEEPVQNPTELLDFPYPFALDETLRETTSLFPYLNCAHLKALILKPMLQYPIEHFLSLGKKIIITSSFESNIGIKHLRKLIHRLNLQSNYHGLNQLQDIEKNAYLPNKVLETTKA